MRKHIKLKYLILITILVVFFTSILTNITKGVSNIHCYTLWSGNCTSCQWDEVPTCSNDTLGTETGSKVCASSPPGCGTNNENAETLCGSDSRSCHCSRNTNGNSCGTTSYSSWSACDNCQYSSACATSGSGTQSRVITQYYCKNGDCFTDTSKSETQNCTCTRSLPSGCGSECTSGDTQSCTTSQNCPGTKTCTNGTWGTCQDNPNDNCPSSCSSGETASCSVVKNSVTCSGTKSCSNGSWGSCVIDACCGVQCTSPAICSGGSCVTPCTECTTTACNEYSPNAGGCQPPYDFQWYCECTGPISGGYTSCIGKCTTIPSGSRLRCINGKCQTSPDDTKPVCPSGKAEGSTCSCSFEEGGAGGEPCTGCGCKTGLSCCPQANGSKICLAQCGTTQVCTPNSSQSCTVKVNGVDCSGTQICKSDGSGWGDCTVTDSTCGYQTCKWKECSSSSFNCTEEKSEQRKANESCPSGCSSDNECGQTCTWKTCNTTTNKCDVINSQRFSLTATCPSGCTTDAQCATTKNCSWKTCNTSNNTCSVSHTSTIPIDQTCPDGCSSNDDCQKGLYYSCNSSSGCIQDPDGSYSGLGACQNYCKRRCNDINSCSSTYSTDTSYPSCSSNSNCMKCTASGTCSSSGTGSWCTNDDQCVSIKYSCDSNLGCIQSSAGSYTTSNCDNKCAHRCNSTTCDTAHFSTDTSKKICSSNSECGTPNCDDPREHSPHNMCSLDQKCISSNACGIDECDSNDDCVPPCQIYEFSLNGKTNKDTERLIIWVNSLIKGTISVNDKCVSCAVTSNNDWNETYDPLSSTYITKQFKISQSGDYYFTLKCTSNPSKDPHDCQSTDPDCAIDDGTLTASSLHDVEVRYLPFWREIIPNLQGFLRGLFPREF